MKVNQKYLSPWHYVIFEVFDSIRSSFTRKNPYIYFSPESKEHRQLDSIKHTIGDTSTPAYLNEEDYLYKQLNPDAILGQFKGSFQPLVTTLRRATRMFSRYKHNRKRLEDYGQFIYGILNVISAVVMVAIAAIQFVVYGAFAVLFSFALILTTLKNLALSLGSLLPFLNIKLEKSDSIGAAAASVPFLLVILHHMLVLPITWLLDAINTTARGILQITLYPVTLILAILVREPHTYLRGTPKIEDNAGVQYLVDKIDTKNRSSYETILELHGKYLKGVREEQPSNITRSKESDLFSDVQINNADESSVLQYVSLFKPSLNAAAPLESPPISSELKL